jgi:hypothetical protein
MLSKNFEYTGHFRYFFQMDLPIEGGAAVGDGLLQRETLAADDDVAQAFVGGAAFVGGGVVEANQRSSMPPRLRP